MKLGYNKPDDFQQLEVQNVGLICLINTQIRTVWCKDLSDMILRIQPPALLQCKETIIQMQNNTQKDGENCTFKGLKTHEKLLGCGDSEYMLENWPAVMENE